MTPRTLAALVGGVLLGALLTMGAIATVLGVKYRGKVEPFCHRRYHLRWDGTRYQAWRYGREAGR